MRNLVCSIGAVCLLMSSSVLGAGIGSGRGGFYFHYHGSSLNSFDPALNGNPFVIGGAGFGAINKTFRIGGGGGGGFIWSGNDSVNFGMGYGGAIAEFTVLPWLNASLLIGGGGYSVAKTLSQTDTTTTVQKINSGGYLLFYPSLTADVSIDGWVFLGFHIGYFLPNVSKLQSFTTGIHVTFGKM
jgi:hypothetical protein